MASVRNDVQLRFRPGAMKIPGAPDRTNKIVTTLNNHSGYRADPANVLNQIIVGTEEGVVHKIMTFNPGEGEGKLRVGKFLNHGRVEEEFRSASLPDAPGSCCLQTDSVVCAGEPAMISTCQVSAFVYRNDLQVFLPDIGKNLACAFLIEPANLFRAAKKDSAQ